MSLEAAVADLSEPPQPSVPCFLIGRDADGHWLAVETHGRGGGLFATREAAARFAASETARRAGAIVFSMTPLQLRMG